MMDLPQTIVQHYRVLAAGRQYHKTWPTAYPRRPFWRLYWNNGPGGVWRESGTTFRGDRDVLIVIPPNIPVQRQLTRPIDHAHLHFSLGMPLDLYRGGIERIAAPSEIDQMMQEISTPNQTFRWRFVVSGLIDHVLASLPQSDISALQMDPRLESLLQYMHSNTHRQVLNNELAQQCHLSEPSMVRLFTKHLGRSPQAFFSDMRLDAAAALLRQIPDRSVEDIAQKTGFFDRSHFCKRFVARFGISPVAYRKSP